MVRRCVGLGLVVLCMALVLNAPAARGQAVYGSIVGNAADAQGAAVVGAKVTVTNAAKGTTDEATTNENPSWPNKASRSPRRASGSRATSTCPPA